MSRELNVVNSKILKFAGINCRETKKSKKVTLYDLHLKDVVSETPTSFSFYNFLTLTVDFKQKDGQQSSTNSSTDGIEETIITEIDKD